MFQIETVFQFVESLALARRSTLVPLERHAQLVASRAIEGGRTMILNRREALLATGATAGCLSAGILDAKPGSSGTVTGDAGTAIHTYMSQAQVYGFSGQVVAEKGGQVVLDQAYGWSDRAKRRSMGRDTAVGIASITKQFTAAAILKLADAGRLKVTDPLSSFLPEAPADKAGLTLHQLLSHSAGMPPGDVVDDFEVASKTDLLRRVLAAKVVGPPGEKWRYSNAGYNLLAFVVERASGKDYEAFVAEQLFRPAGMRDSGFPRERQLRGKAIAHAYRAWFDEGTPADWPRSNYRPFGSGTAFSTAADLYRWQQTLENGRILKPESARLLVAPHIRIGGEGSPSYGYGAFVEQQKAGTFIERSGDWERGYNAAWHRWPEEDLTLIITSNSTTAAGYSMRQGVQAELESLLRGTQPPPDSLPPSNMPSAHMLREMAGRYRLPSGGAITLSSDGAYLWAIADGQDAVNAMRSVEGKSDENFDAAVQKTKDLLAALQANGSEIYRTTLAHVEELPDYVAEWNGLTAKYGALKQAHVMGAMRQGRSARAVTSLAFERKSITMGFIWSERGKGPLVGSQPETRVPTALAYPMGLAPAGGLAGFEMMNSGRSAPKIQDRHLVFGQILAKRET
jgi:CubicO group peptidase (beta-lactamase class C family)